MSIENHNIVETPQLVQLRSENLNIEYYKIPSSFYIDKFLHDISKRTYQAANRLLAKGPSGEGGLLMDNEIQDLRLSARLDGAIDQLSTPIAEVLNRGGKGWRGYSLAICCRLVGGDFRRHEDWLAFSELLHVGSLIVDDVEDQSLLRRGGPACHLLYGADVAINAGTLAYFSVQRLIENAHVGDAARAAIYREYVSLMRLAHIGQGLDLNLKLNASSIHDLSDTVLLDIDGRIDSAHRLKSGAPFKHFARIGAILGGGRADEIDVLGNYFLEVGASFQLIDELLDVTGFTNGGKERGEDIRNGKWTIPVVRLIRSVRPGKRAQLVDELIAAQTDADVRDQILDRLTQSDIVAACAWEAKETVNRELAKVRALVSDDEAFDLLREFSSMVLEKHY